MNPKYFYVRTIETVDSNILVFWTTKFVDHIFFHTGDNNILFVMDGYASHSSYNLLSLLKPNGVLVTVLPVHTSHTFQPCDLIFKYWIFMCLGVRRRILND